MKFREIAARLRTLSHTMPAWRLSAGWAENPAEAVTCPRCLRKLAEVAP